MNIGAQAIAQRLYVIPPAYNDSQADIATAVNHERPHKPTHNSKH
jgi:hypothetical protein